NLLSSSVSSFTSGLKVTRSIASSSAVTAPAGTMSLGQLRVLSMSAVSDTPRLMSTAATTRETVSTFGPSVADGRSLLIPMAADAPHTRASSRTRTVRTLTGHLEMDRGGVANRGSAAAGQGRYSGHRALLRQRVQEGLAAHGEPPSQM